MASRIIGCGHYLPERIVSNYELERTIDTSDEWIRSRTGILQRHIAANDEYSSHLAYKASLNAIADAKIEISSIDLIIVCTTTPDNSFPATAARLQGYLGLGNIPSFDLQAVCAGFIYGLHVADSLIKSGQYKNILLVCSEKMSSLIDWTDRSTCVLFGDGAGAVVLSHSDSDSKIIDSIISSDGSLYEILATTGGVSSNGISGKIQMEGSAIFRNAIEKMSSCVLDVLKKNNISVDQIDYFIPHQANIRIIQAITERLRVNEDKVIKTIDKHANCSAASIPLALSELKLTKSLKSGDMILFTAFGAGLTWGAAIIRW